MTADRGTSGSTTSWAFRGVGPANGSNREAEVDRAGDVQGEE